ncbi:MAG: hypothetical protein HPY53_15815 [Brevinematales bacterium]|nr:hypothetical protein [Brevinematales bacterium]
MEYLIFEGPTYKDAMNQMYTMGVQKNMLDQMQIIKKVEEEKKSFFGLKKKKNWKIIVGVFEDKPVKRQKSATTQEYATPDLFPNSNPHPQTQSQQDNLNLKTELQDMRKALAEMINSRMNEIKDNLIQDKISREMTQDNQILEDVEISKKNLEWAEKFLRDRTFAQFLIDDMMEHLRRQKSDVRIEKAHMLGAVRDFLTSNLVSEDISIDNYNFGNIILFAGPTGVGKTITLVKMAAHVAEMRRKKMRFISVDRYKVGADSQLKTYAELLKVPFYPIHKQEDFFDLININESDFTFIDTAGKSPRETIAIKELGDWIKRTGKKIDIHLVVSATTKPQDLDYIIEKYSVLDYHHIIATKFDETRHMGSVISAVYRAKKPLSFVTNGQEVPQDFKIANLESIIADSIK